jgi:hypothetical protein
MHPFQQTVLRRSTIFQYLNWDGAYPITSSTTSHHLYVHVRGYRSSDKKVKRIESARRALPRDRPAFPYHPVANSSHLPLHRCNLDVVFLSPPPLPLSLNLNADGADADATLQIATTRNATRVLAGLALAFFDPATLRH